MGGGWLVHQRQTTDLLISERWPARKNPSKCFVICRYSCHSGEHIPRHPGLFLSLGVPGPLSLLPLRPATPPSAPSHHIHISAGVWNSKTPPLAARLGWHRPPRPSRGKFCPLRKCESYIQEAPPVGSLDNLPSQVICVRSMVTYEIPIYP